MIVIIKYKNQEYRCFFRPFQAPGRLAYRLLQTLDNTTLLCYIEIKNHVLQNKKPDYFCSNTIGKDESP